ncbi:MAG: type II toxin-antitoxin system VapC family toxin [Trueperaceae bacterium]
MTLLDTHVWLWWLSDPSLLTETAKAQIAAAIDGDSLAASSISAWEAEMLVKKGRLELTLAVDDLVSHCDGLSFFSFVPLTAKTGLQAARMEPFHPDPADRMIVATTIHYGGILITKDERIRKYGRVRTVW